MFWMLLSIMLLVVYVQGAHAGDSFDMEQETRICGVNPKDWVYCATRKNNKMTMWDLHSGIMSHVTVHGDHMFGVSRNHSIYYKPFHGKNWVHLVGQLKQVDFDGTTLCGVNSLDHIYCAREGIFVQGRPKWYRVTSELSYVVVKNRELLGVNKHDVIYRIKNFEALDCTMPQWVKLYGHLKKVSLGGQTICGISTHQHIYCAPNTDETVPKFYQIPGEYLHVEIAGDMIWAIKMDGDSYVSPYPEIKWEKLTGRMAQFSVSNGEIPPETFDEEITGAEDEM